MADDTTDPRQKAINDIIEAAKRLAELKGEKGESPPDKGSNGKAPSPGNTGALELTDKPGVMEATLLAAKAVIEAAKRIALKVAEKVGNGTSVFIYACSEVPTFQARHAFLAQIELLKNVFDHARSECLKAGEKEPEERPVGPEAFLPLGLPAIASALGSAASVMGAVDQLLGYLKSDYSAGGVELSFEDSLLVHALAGALRNENEQLKVILPAFYFPSSPAKDLTERIPEIRELASKKNACLVDSIYQALLAATFLEAAKNAEESKKPELTEKATSHKKAFNECNVALANCTDFFKKILTADDKGVVPLACLARDEEIYDTLKQSGNSLLAVRLQKAGGAYYTKKNLITSTGLWGMPLYHMGGIVVSYVLLKGKDGTVLCSGVIPIHGGFKRAGRLDDYMKETSAKEKDDEEETKSKRKS